MECGLIHSELMNFETSTMIPPSVARAVPDISAEASEPRFDVLAYPERIDEILELRRLANCSANLLPPETLAAELIDPRDFEASNVVAEISGRLVGTLRLAPPLEGFILNQANPCVRPVNGLPGTSEYLETAWASIHPNYHGRGILWHLVAHMVLTAKQRAKPFLVGGTSPDMWRFWRRCGYRKTGILYLGRNAPSLQYSVIILDVEAAIEGRNIAPQLARVLGPLLDGSADLGRHPAR